MKLAVIGTGYVGLVAGAGFSDFGNDVTCVDLDESRIERLNGGEIPIFEPGLANLVHRNTAAGRLSFTSDTATAIAGADVAFIAVGTPTRDGHRAANLDYVLAAAEAIARAQTGPLVVVTKSTVPVGTAARIHATMAAIAEHPFSVASNPEFLKEGDAVNDFMKPARILIGASDDGAITVLRNLYAPFVRTSDRIQVMDPPSAELAKYAANAMLATRISFMNELSRLAEAVGADIEKVRKAVGADPRIGQKFLFAGPGFGGSCFPKDLRALIATGEEAGVNLRVVAAAEHANERQKQVLPDKVKGYFGGNLEGKRVAVWGLAFKPETDDIRESPALVLIDALIAGGAEVSAYDPAAMDHVRARLGDAIELAPSMYDAARGADALVLVTEWHELRRPDFQRLAAIMRAPVVFDGRNVWNPEELVGLGFTYHGIGRRR
ncbi:MAG TPA: UDP-glucose/GDP-mannose dehydrogenase family protein [Kofleriaceae bacterium]|nr:UDP-glucose/GDP-mannose dehydrogenase family protein [Kofleriaceae bacterium]